MANLTQNIFKNTYNLYAKKVTENGEKILWEQVWEYQLKALKTCIYLDPEIQCLKINSKEIIKYAYKI